MTGLPSLQRSEDVNSTEEHAGGRAQNERLVRYLLSPDPEVVGVGREAKRNKREKVKGREKEELGFFL